MNSNIITVDEILNRHRGVFTTPSGLDGVDLTDENKDSETSAQEYPSHGEEQEDMKRLKDWLLDEEEPLADWLKGSSEDLEGEQADQLEDAKKLEEENRSLRQRMKELSEEVPEDQASILGKELELQEREEKLERRERALQSNEEGDLESRYHEELREKEEEFQNREEELNSRIEELERQLQEKESDYRMREEELRLAKMESPDAEKELEEKYQELHKKEQSINQMEKEMQNLKAELTQKDEELRKLRELLSYKESEFSQREEDLVYREKRLDEERRRFDEAKKETSGIEEAEMKRRLEELKEEINQKEEDLRNREKYLSSKEQDLKKREQGIIEEEIETREEERAYEIQQAKVKTGNRRLDDLLLGGIPFGSNILVHGPPFTGKETLVGQFIAEGLKKGIPCIWVLTDKTPGDIRNEMQFVLSGYEEYENLGLVKYVDSYSMSMGETTGDPLAIFLEEPADHKRLGEAVEEIISELQGEGHDVYRLAFRSVSTLIAYSDPISTFRFMSPFCGKRKREKAVSMYTMEKGMHSDQEIQMLGSVMDGMIDFKVDQLKTFFAIKGITDVQSRSYIRYTATRSGLSIGSFSLDHIR